MADNNVTESQTTDTTTQQPDQPVAQTTAQAAPTPAAVHAHAPSPAALAKTATHTPVAKSSGFALADIAKAESFGRVDDNGVVYVKEGDTEREVGQYPDASHDEALALYARRYLDLKAKLDLFATRLKSNSIKPREIDETLKTLTAETENPDVVGDIAALHTQLDELKTEAQAKKESIAQARKEAMAKAVAERTKIVEKAEQLAANLGDNTNWRSTADKFRSLFEQWQNHQRTTIRIDKADADALWKRFSAARTTFNQARRKWAQARDNERSQAKKVKEEIIAEANELKESTAWAQTSRRFNELMDRWKQAGRAGRSEEAKKARQQLAEIQEEWDQIGYVPREDMRRIEGRLDDVDKQIKAVEDAAWKQADPEADARKSSFEGQLKAQLDELDERIAKESDPKKKASLEAEKATKEQWLNAIM